MNSSCLSRSAAGQLPTGKRWASSSDPFQGEGREWGEDRSGVGKFFPDRGSDELHTLWAFLSLGCFCRFLETIPPLGHPPKGSCLDVYDALFPWLHTALWFLSQALGNLGSSTPPVSPPPPGPSWQGSKTINHIWPSCWNLHWSTGNDHVSFAPQACQHRLTLKQQHLLGHQGSQLPPLFAFVRHESVAQDRCGHLVSSLRQPPSSILHPLGLTGPSRISLKFLLKLQQPFLQPLLLFMYYSWVWADGADPGFHCLFPKSHLVSSHLTLECDIY